MPLGLRKGAMPGLEMGEKAGAMMMGLLPWLSASASMSARNASSVLVKVGPSSIAAAKIGSEPEVGPRFTPIGARGYRRRKQYYSRKRSLPTP